jgi:HAD superfamily hydrolase (TIGR01484 family)
LPSPISQMQAPDDLLGIFCDIDDTLTVDGRLVPGVLDWMTAARSRGLAIVPITGRPGGWVDHIARAWPVDGVVGENGGLWFWFDGRKLQRRFFQPADERRINRVKLDALATTILERVPGSALASDQPYRDLDLAIDFCEDVPALSSTAIDAIVSCFIEAGATAKISSIHVNGWYGHFDKLEGVQRFHQDRYGTAIDFQRWAFFGDSANDEPMFKAFPYSIGVANVRDFLDRMTHHPRFITQSVGGHGFCEGMSHLLGTSSPSQAG